MKPVLLIFISLVTFSFALQEESLPQLAFKTEVNALSWEKGDTIQVVLEITIPEAYHLYGNPLGPGPGKPLQITVSEVDGVKWLGSSIEKPSKYIPKGLEDLWTWSYEEKTKIYFSGVLSKALSSEKARIIIDGLVCKTACIPVYGEHLFEIKSSGNELVSPLGVQEIPFEVGEKFIGDEADEVGSSGRLLLSGGSESLVTPHVKIDVDHEVKEIEESTLTEEAEEKGVKSVEEEPKEDSEEEELSLGWALFFAFLAGIILNFMPCVLPVLGIKILSFSKGREGSKVEAVMHSVAFAIGMILVFLVLASFAAFAEMSWGQQFQNPIFMIAVISMIFVFALGMFDLFIILVPSKVSEMEVKSSKEGLWGNFLKGVFATILATPCSGPLLGTTLLWTLSQPPLVIYLVFFFLGLGMAFPYILLASSERLSKMIPKPGPWMDDFKHVLGFFLFGFAVYLLSVLPIPLIVPTVGLQVVLAFALILYTRIAPFGSSLKAKLIALVIVVGIVIGGVHTNYTLLFKGSNIEVSKVVPKERKIWNDFYQSEFDKALATKEDIIIDFTAKWCMNCQYNKSRVYNTEKMKEKIKSMKIYAIRGDLTQKNPPVQKLRDALGSRSIPFLVLIPKGDTTKAVRLRDIVTPGQVYGEMDRLFRK